MNTLDYLSEDQRDQLYNWLLDMPTKQVVDKVALPAPDGFGIKTHVTTLRRFKDRRWAELAADHIQTATQLTGTTAEQHDKLDTGILTAIKHHMFERASAHDITDEQLALVSRWSHRQEKLKLEIQRVQIARERCAQNQLRLQLLARSRNISFGGTFPRQAPPSPLGGERVGVRGDAAQPSPDAPNVSKPDHPVNPVTNSSALPALNSPSETSSFVLPNSSLPDDRPCDHLGPLARTWDDIPARVQKKFGITPEEYARRVELCRTWKNPYSDSPSTLNACVRSTQAITRTDVLSTAATVNSAKDPEIAEIPNPDHPVPPIPDPGNTLASADAPC